MPLLERTLFGTVDMVALAIERLRQFEPPEGYWLAFSGGKDSTVIHDLALRAGVRFTPHYNITTMDPPPLIRHMHRHYPELIWDKPSKRYEAVLLEMRFPPLRTMRWCCKHFKEAHGEGLIVTGIRREESVYRRKRPLIESCYRNGRKTFLNVIVDWTEADVWEYIRSTALPFCELYDQGWKRIGCVMCPCAGRERRRRDAERWPAMARRFVRAFQRLVEYRRGDGHKPLPWKTGQDLFDWWLADERKADKDIAGQMFFEAAGGADG